MLLEKVGMRQASWDKRVFIYHVGPLSDKGAYIGDIVQSLAAPLPDVGGRPCGFAIFGTHSDDGIGGANVLTLSHSSTCYTTELGPGVTVVTQ